MSYDLGLKDSKTQDWMELKENHHMKGGTYQLGGCPTAEINITWNYRRHFVKVLPERESSHNTSDDGKLYGIRTLYGLTGEESIPLLENAISQLKDDISDDYWEPTEGNAKQALVHCLELAKLAPEGIWDGD